MTRVLASARPPFLILGPLVVGLAVAATLAQGSAVDWTAMALILVASVAGHVSANAFNEYFDHRSGLDSRTRRTPFSGGSGLLPAQPQLASAVLAMAIVSLLLSLTIGAWLAWTREPALIVLGALGVILVYGYTRWMHRWPIGNL